MDFYALLNQVIDLLRRRGRVSYRTLKLQFNLTDEAVAALKDERIAAQQLAVDEQGKVLVWTGVPAYALRLLGDIAAHREPPEIEPAQSAYRQALALAEELSMHPLQSHCHHSLGRLYARTGQGEQARAELFASIEMYRLMAMTLWLLQAEAALAQVEGR